MAIYQFLIFVLPRKSIENKFGRIPKQLEINHAEWEKYWDNYDVDAEIEAEPEFEDAISTKWWKKIPINKEELINEIDKIITRATWNNGASWKTENAEFDHDLSIDFNEDAGYIEDFRFRADLTDSSLVFLNSILDLCRKNEWVLMDEKGNLCEPENRKLEELIRDSRANRFLINPIGFFDSLKED